MSQRKSGVTVRRKRRAMPEHSSEESFVLACLVVVNDIHPGDTHAGAEVRAALSNAKVMGSSEHARMLRGEIPLLGTDPWEDVAGSRDPLPPQPLPAEAHALRDRLTRELEAVVGNVPAARRLRRGRTDSQLDDVFVWTTLALRADGRLEHRHMYVGQSHDGIAGLLTAFILDPTQRFGRDLRVCALPDCPRYFLAEGDAGGGPRPRYCSEAHSKTAGRTSAARRAKKYRSKPAAKPK